jgi:hypothetical protein
VVEAAASCPEEKQSSGRLLSPRPALR